MTTEVRCRECDAVAPPSAGWCGACGAALGRRGTGGRSGALPGPRPPTRTPGRSTVWLAVASIVLAAAGAVAVVSGRVGGASLGAPQEVASGASDRRGAPTVTTVSGAPLDVPTWHLPTPGPVDENAAPAVVWTGERMFVWGGESRVNAPSSEGALYDPATDTWERIAPVPHPVGGRLDGVAEWTGAEVFVWGYGGEGRAALYDPAENEWRQAPSASIPGRFSPTSVWTGTEVIVFGGWNPNLGNELRDGAAYDPQTDTWRSIPDVPLEGTTEMDAVWTGDLVIAFGGRAAASYDPTTDAWQLLPEAPTRPLRDPSVVWTGSQVVVWGSVPDAGGTENDAAAFDPSTDTWRSLPSAPLDPPPPCECNGGQAAVWAGDRLVAWSGTLDTAGPVGLAFDPTTDSWDRIGVALTPSWYDPSLVWTGAEAIVWGGRGSPLDVDAAAVSEAGDPVPFHGGGVLLRLRDGRRTGALEALGDEPTGARVYLTYPLVTRQQPGSVRIIDVDARRERRLEVPEVAPGDALFRLEPVDGQLVFWGGDLTYALDPDDGTMTELGRALQFVPAAEAGRVWLLAGVAGTQQPGGKWEELTVRQVDLEGNVTVPEVPMGGGLAGAVDGAVIREGVVDVWNPVTDEVIADLGPAWVIATHGSLVAACTPPACRAVRIRDIATGDQTVVEPDPTLREFHGSRGRFSPDGRRLAVGVVTVEGSMVALLDDAGGIDRVGPYGGGGVGWAPTGALVFRLPDGRLGVHLPSGLRVVPVDLGESFGFAVGGA